MYKNHSDTFFDSCFAKQRVMAILRGYDLVRTVALAGQAWDLGVDLVEVPVHTEDAYESFSAAAAAAKSRGALIGAGTVYRIEQVDRILEMGADFAVAPGFDPTVADYCRERNLPYLPGVATASEIQAVLRLDYHWCKAFPARELSAEWIRAMRAPFPGVSFVATGGVDAGNAIKFLEAGARGVAVGSALDDPAQLAVLAELAATSPRSRSRSRSAERP